MLCDHLLATGAFFCRIRIICIFTLLFRYFNFGIWELPPPLCACEHTQCMNCARMVRNEQSFHNLFHVKYLKKSKAFRLKFLFFTVFLPKLVLKLLNVRSLSHTCPKLTAACWAEALNTMAVRYSISSSRDFRDFGNSEHGLWTDTIDKVSLNSFSQGLLYKRSLHNNLRQVLKKYRKSVTQLVLS